MLHFVYVFLVLIFMKNFKPCTYLESLLFFLASVLNLMWVSIWLFARLLTNICPSNVHWIIGFPVTCCHILRSHSWEWLFSFSSLSCARACADVRSLCSTHTTYPVPLPEGSPEQSLDFQPNSFPSCKTFCICNASLRSGRPWLLWWIPTGKQQQPVPVGKVACGFEPASTAPIKAFSLQPGQAQGENSLYQTPEEHCKLWDPLNPPFNTRLGKELTPSP